MKKTPLQEDRMSAMIQWNAAHTLIDSLERRLAISQDELTACRKELLLVDRKEIDSLYERNEWLTNMLEEQRRTIEALLMGCNEKGLDGSTAVLTYIAKLETMLGISV